MRSRKQGTDGAALHQQSISLDSASLGLSTPGMFRLLLWVRYRSLASRFAQMYRDTPLLIVVLGCFVAGYLGAGYFLFHAGLGYLFHFPLIGALLSQRILYLIFGFFFVMLAFSNLIIGYSTLFKNVETTWLLTLPLPHRSVYCWKFFEALVVSSWALIFLSAPMMAAYGRVHSVPAIFYLEVAVAYLPFVVLPAVTGSWLIVFFVRFVGHRNFKRIAAGLCGLVLLLLIVGIHPVSDGDAMAQQEILSFDHLLHHTRLSVNPFLPSAWLAQAVLSWGDHLQPQGFFFFLLLLSYALMGLLLSFEVVGRSFFSSWTSGMSFRAERFLRHAEKLSRRATRVSQLERVTDLVRPYSPPVAALILKDVRLFWRDPSQWIQFVVFFALLCTYVVNLRNITFDFQNPFWETIISYLNLSASALTLSTLTTRFVYPQFSLEGRRLWILGLAPLGLDKVLLQKFWLSCLTSTVITTSLMVASSLLLHLPGGRITFFAVATGVMSATLCGLAVGLGALFPNFKEDNPSKIVSGFGGTLCLVGSFIYISLFVAAAALPDLARATRMPVALSPWLAYSFALLLSCAVLLLPLFSACRVVKNLEI